MDTLNEREVCRINTMGIFKGVKSGIHTTCQPSAIYFGISLRSVLRGTRQMPVDEGLSEYGLYILAPQLPNAPNRCGVKISLNIMRGKFTHHRRSTLYSSSSDGRFRSQIVSRCLCPNTLRPYLPLSTYGAMVIRV
jgi:hypothetical protein